MCVTTRCRLANSQHLMLRVVTAAVDCFFVGVGVVAGGGLRHSASGANTKTESFNRHRFIRKLNFSNSTPLTITSLLYARQFDYKTCRRPLNVLYHSILKSYI